MKSRNKLGLLLLACCISASAAQAQLVTCESNGNDRNSCNVDTRGGVRLVRQESKADCIAGQTWGYDDLGIWVRGGCRAVFEVTRGYDGRPAYNRNNPQPAYNPPAARAQVCPSGFSPSEQKCSSDERRQGCKDIRMDSGMGCVKRR